MTARELFEQLEHCGLADARLVYPNWIYERPNQHLAEVEDWFEDKNGDVHLTIDIQAEMRS